MKTIERSYTGTVFSGSMYIIIFAIGIPLIYLLFSLSLDQYLGNNFTNTPQITRLVGLILFITGGYIIITATLKLYNVGKGLPISSSPPENLVMDGPYAWSRHPIYLGAVSLFAGISLLLTSLSGFFIGTPLLGFFYFLYARGIEEPQLINRYSDSYLKYQRNVPFVIRYPFRKGFHRIFRILLSITSNIINRPKMFIINKHIFFWGYGIWPGIGVALGLMIMEYILLVQGIPDRITAVLIITLTVLGLLGVRFTWRFITTIGKHLNFKKTAGVVGFMSWGTLLALFLTVILFHLITPYSAGYLLDAALPGILLTHFWGRIGCLFYGCCYGKPAQGVCGIQYRHPELKVLRIEHLHEKRVLPVQLFSSIYGLMGFLLIFGYWSWHTLPMGTAAAFAAIWYGSFRIDEEWLREQSVTWLRFISPAQVISFLLIVTGLAWFLLNTPESLPVYSPLIHSNLITVLERMHPGLLLGSGLLTTFVFSYHYKEIGKWK